jgi:hypothetical protein
MTSRTVVAEEIEELGIFAIIPPGTMSNTRKNITERIEAVKVWDEQNKAKKTHFTAILKENQKEIEKYQNHLKELMHKQNEHRDRLTSAEFCVNEAKNIIVKLQSTPVVESAGVFESLPDIVVLNIVWFLGLDETFIKSKLYRVCKRFYGIIMSASTKLKSREWQLDSVFKRFKYNLIVHHRSIHARPIQASIPRGVNKPIKVGDKSFTFNKNGALKSPIVQHPIFKNSWICIVEYQYDLYDEIKIHLLDTTTGEKYTYYRDEDDYIRLSITDDSILVQLSNGYYKF